jgi:hypothetical protein
VEGLAARFQRYCNSTPLDYISLNVKRGSTARSAKRLELDRESQILSYVLFKECEKGSFFMYCKPVEMFFLMYLIGALVVSMLNSVATEF